MFFEIPTQVKFYDSEDYLWHAGIAYKDEVICGCCGGVHEVGEIENLIPFDDWISIEDEIMGN